MTTNSQSIETTNTELERLVGGLNDASNGDICGLDGAWLSLCSYLDSHVQIPTLARDLQNAIYAINDPHLTISARGEWISRDGSNHFWFDLICGILSFHLENDVQATAHFRDALQIRPSAQHVHQLLHVLQISHQWELSISIAKFLIHESPNDPVAWLAIGRGHRELGSYDQAIQKLDEAIEQFPNDPDIWCELGNARLDMNSNQEAVDAFQKARVQNHQHWRAAAGCFVALESLGRTEDSVGLMELLSQPDAHCELICDKVIAVLVQNDRLPPAEQLLGAWRSSMATCWVMRWEKILRSARNPDSPPNQLPSESTAQLFDRRANARHTNTRSQEIAKQFLLGTLEPPQRKIDILDLGCGFGRDGDSLREFAGELTGVDASEKMLRKAQWRGKYDHLECTDIESFLSSTDRQFDLVFANNTLVHWGELESVFGGIQRVLKPNGNVIFDLACQEAGAQTPYTLEQNGQYQHSLAYVQQTLASMGLHPVLMERRVPHLLGCKSVYHFMTHAVCVSTSVPPPAATQFRDQSPADEQSLLANFCQLNPEFYEAHLKLGNAEFALGNSAKAIEAFQKSLHLDATADGFTGLGNALVQTGKLENALEAFESAVACDPTFLPALNNAGRAAQELGNVETAQRYLDRTLTIDPNNAKAHAFLGMLHEQLNQPQQATEHFSKSLKADPRQPEILMRLGRLERMAGKFSQAMNSLVQAQQLIPDSPHIYSQLGEANIAQGRITEAGFCFLRALQLNPDDSRVHSHLINAMLCEPGVNGDKLHQEAQRWNIRHAAQESISRHADEFDRSPNRILRIGFIAPEINSCEFGMTMAPIISKLDENDFEVILYVNQLYDHLPQAWVAESNTLKATKTLSDHELAKLVIEDNIDILVDLGGHSAGHRLRTLALRPAPIQMTWQLRPSTTGVSAVDYILADRHTIPERSRENYSEQPLYLPGCFLSFELPTAANQTDRPPVAETGQITFGCISSMDMISLNSVSIWSKLLLLVPNSRLYVCNSALADTSVSGNLEDQFSENGISKDRLWLDGSCPSGCTQDKLANIDIGLDPFPVSDVVGNVRMLAMGIPVVSTSDDRFSSRTTSSVLNCLGLESWHAANPDEYIDRAQNLAQDVPELTRLRGDLGERLRSSNVGDPSQFANQLKTVFRQTWQNWCDVQNP